MATKTIRQEVFIDAKPEQVYEALANPKKHSEFTSSPATGAPKKGGKFTAWDGYIFGKHIELVKGKKIVQEWQTTEWPKGAEPSIVEFTFVSRNGGTLLTMVHSQVPAGQSEDYAEGWREFYWKPLAEYFRQRK